MSDTKSTPIFKRGTDGKVRQWQYEVDDSKYRIIYGIRGGNLVTSEWTNAKPKNVGRANETTPEQQAILEAEAEETKKLKREYRRTIAELEFVPDGPMLAADYTKVFKKAGPDFGAGVFSQPKLDGIRAMMNLKHGATTRELQPHHNCAHLMAALDPIFASFPDIQFDGELYNHDLKDDFNEISSLVRKPKIDEERLIKVQRTVQYHVYDLPGPGVFSERTTKLRALVERLNHPMIVYVPTSIVHSQEDLDALNFQYTEDGYEGQMVRTNDLGYEFDSRSKSLLKRKEFTTEEFTLLDIQEGEGNWAGHAKRIVIQLPNDETCEGSLRGNKDFTRQLLADKDAYSQVTVRHFGYTPAGKLRHAVGIDFHRGERID